MGRSLKTTPNVYELDSYTIKCNVHQTERALLEMNCSFPSVAYEVGRLKEVMHFLFVLYNSGFLHILADPTGMSQH